MINKNFWETKRVLITGHTGFKGSWLWLWLSEMGSTLCGYSLDIQENSLFKKISADKNNKNFSHYGDIDNEKYLRRVILDFNPDIIFHLAAQPLVIDSYKLPIYTWQTNVIGTLKLLESTKSLKNKCSIVVITTDKVYKNKEWEFGYRESDRLGGLDPYSASKAATELAVESWRNSFIGSKTNQIENISLCTARSGNVIGGGDWSENRIIPDAIKAISTQKEIVLRNPKSTRPWQHVLDPINGYISLAEKLYSKPKEFSSSFNFGPTIDSNKTVEELIIEASKYWECKYKFAKTKNVFHEASMLHLQIDKAVKSLGWSPVWDFQKSVERTILWYKTVNEGENPLDVCKKDIEIYSQELNIK